MTRAMILAALLTLTACAHKPLTVAHPSCGTGWDDCAWQEVLSNA